MRTLAILAAILLVALQAQAESLQTAADEAVTQYPSEEDHKDVTVSFAGNGLSAFMASGSRARAVCYCRSGCCDYPESHTGRCTQGGRSYRLCCR
ncbi:defensin alpha 5 [Saimiri boliviensis]|uniref:Defensin alpha 5 n=1 Tax=Saimiri boliviensis boliviensis TaxID=39432 RepID=A0A2K6U2S7_SAIBB|nr:defensin-5 [Saimiri boliviensis boliviensis]